MGLFLAGTTSETSHGDISIKQLGQSPIGVVTGGGTAVTEFKIGDQLFGQLPIRETYTVEADDLNSLP